MNTDHTFVRYDSGVEVVGEDEENVLHEVVDTQRAIVELMNGKYRHAVRGVHSKSHGVLTGTLNVSSGVEAPYAQGLFAKPGSYVVVVRLSTNPADLLPDDVSTPRGFALKVLGPEGEVMLDGHEAERTQDFLFVSGPVFGASTPKEFASQMKFFLDHLFDPEQRKSVVSAIARPIEKMFTALKMPNPTVASLGGAPPSHLLGETFYSQLATRHGDFVAHYALTPKSDNLNALKGVELDLENPDCLRDSIVDFFKDQGGVWNFGVQLCTDLEKMPVEDGSKQWPEDESPFVTVAELTIDPQPAYTPERRTYADDFLSFSPWHGLEAHRPLGAHNRVRKAAYAMSAEFRRTQNVRPKREPRAASEFFAVESDVPA